MMLVRSATRYYLSCQSIDTHLQVTTGLAARRGSFTKRQMRQLPRAPSNLPSVGPPYSQPLPGKYRTNPIKKCPVYIVFCIAPLEPVVAKEILNAQLIKCLFAQLIKLLLEFLDSNSFNLLNNSRQFCNMIYGRSTLVLFTWPSDFC